MGRFAFVMVLGLFTLACGEIREVEFEPEGTSNSTGATDSGSSETTVTDTDTDADTESAGQDSGSTGPVIPERDFFCGPGTTIPDEDTAGIQFVIDVDDSRTITDLNINVRIMHGDAASLTATIEHGGVQVLLVEPRNGDCELQFDAIFDDEAEMTSTDSCEVEVPDDGLHLIPMEALDALEGGAADGPWTLTVSDRQQGDVGEVQGWCVSIDFP